MAKKKRKPARVTDSVFKLMLADGTFTFTQRCADTQEAWERLRRDVTPHQTATLYGWVTESVPVLKSGEFAKFMNKVGIDPVAASKKVYWRPILFGDTRFAFHDHPTDVYGRKFVEEFPLQKMFDEFGDHRRLQTFVHKGCKCVFPGCDREGTRFILTQSRSGGKHYDLYTDDYILMTVDHIQPKSKGGKDVLDNYQPMCADHNVIKGNKIIN